METNRFYNEILTEHNLHPEFKHDLPDADIELAGVNPSCGLCELFQKMIRGEASEDEIDHLEEAGALRDVAHMPARVKCAMLGWRTLNEALRSKHDKPNS